MPYKIKSAPRKSILEPEELVSRSEALLWRLTDYRRSIAVGTGLILAVGLAVGGGFWYVSDQNKKARVLEYEAMKLTVPASGGAAGEGEPDYAKASELYRELLARYPGSASAPFAQFQLGNTFYELGQYDQALAAYRDFIDHYSQDKTLLPVVHQRMGYVYLAKGDSKAALGAFDRVIGTPGAWNRAQAFYESGRIHEKAGDEADAISRYEGLIKEYPRSPWGREAQSRLKVLGVFEASASGGDDKGKAEGKQPKPAEKPAAGEKK